MNSSDTIFALATPSGRSGVAVIRVSGKASWESLRALREKKERATEPEIEPRKAFLAVLTNPVSRETIDEAMILPFQSPASFTGEDVVEYHIHGSPAVIESLLNFLGDQEHHRLAQPGEFTRRAFENGKIDLTKAEAIADLIESETQAQKTQALAQMGGALKDLYEGWAGQLKQSLAHLEADIEFPDEDLPEGILPELLPKIEILKSEILAHLDDNRRGERLRDGVQIAVIGAPNSGKSSLVNALAKRDVAIVSDIAGTTRDVIEAHLDIDGYPVILSDTAGLRPEEISHEGQDAIEQEGIKRALARAKNSDIQILVFDGTTENPDPATLALISPSSLCVINKSDQPLALKNIEDCVLISAETGEGLDEFLKVLAARIKDLVGLQETPSLTRKRHRAALKETLQALDRSVTNNLPELVAEDIRLAVRALGRITGRVDVEDLLDTIFSDFCIGK